jgi:ABC-type antimicrobial peptide transport system permease subunit
VLLVSVFGILATLIASVGVFGTTAVSVARRTREMGIRMALGAQGGSLVRMATLGTVRAGAVGIGVGTLGALAVTRLLSSYLFGIEPWDPMTYAGALLLLGGLSVLAAALPARRVTRIAPMEVLREE